MLNEHYPTFPGLSIPGKPFYADRAVVLPGTAVVQWSEHVFEHWQWLREVGIGPGTLIPVPPSGDSEAHLLDEILAEPKCINDIQRALEVDPDHRVQFFNVTDREEEAITAIGIPRSQVWGASAALSQSVNDKCELRKLGRELGLKHIFPRFEIAAEFRGRSVRENDVVGALASLRTDGVKRALVKRGDLASGDGKVSVSASLIPTGEMEQLFAFLVAHRAPGRRFLVEECIGDHTPLSVQWEVGDHGVYRRVAASRQIVTQDGEHLGNVTGSGDIPGLSSELAEQMFRLSEPFMRHFAIAGWRGVCGFDFMREESTGKLYMTECNGRVTALTYAAGIGEQVKERLRGQWGIAMRHIRPPKELAHPHLLMKALGERLFDGTCGAIPMNLRCLSLPKPKCMVACVAATSAEAETMLAEVRTRLSCSLEE